MFLSQERNQTADCFCFDASTEPLAEAIRQNSDIKGTQDDGGMGHKINIICGQFINIYKGTLHIYTSPIEYFQRIW